MVYDGVLNRKIGRVEPWLTDNNPHWSAYQQEWEPHFLATICPQCGAAMQGEHDSLVMNCYNCDSCWAEKKGKFVPVPYTLADSREKELAAASILAYFRGDQRNQDADAGRFLRATNQPVVVNWKHEEQDLEFWVPAMKLRPKIFLKAGQECNPVAAEISCR